LQFGRSQERLRGTDLIREGLVLPNLEGTTHHVTYHPSLTKEQEQILFLHLRGSDKTTLSLLSNPEFMRTVTVAKSDLELCFSNK
jgi:hypothetical protein